MKDKKAIFKTEPFSYAEVKAAAPLELVPPVFFKARDGIDLAVYRFTPADRPRAVLIFIHGAGAHCFLSSYQKIGFDLKDHFNIETWLLDLRGHGRSGGRRGDAASSFQVWDDIKTVVADVKTERAGMPVVLGGHSAGGGTVINYANWKRRTEADGYIIVAPYLGYKSGVARNNLLKDNFARVQIFNYICYKLSLGLFFGHAPAVYYNYTGEQLRKDPLKINSISCAMGAACTLWNPGKEFRNLKKPLAIFVGGEDELFDPRRVARYFDCLDPEIKKTSQMRIIDGEKHLSILLGVSHYIGEAMRTWHGASLRG